MLDSPYTRYPVYRESLDDIVGVLHVRDLFTAVHDRGLADVRLEEIVRPAYIVPETKDLASLLQEFRKTNNHFAVVVDEYGGMAGICTLEDLLEEIVGEIEDEFDISEEPIEQIDDDNYRVDGDVPDRRVQRALRHRPAGRRLPHASAVSSSAARARAPSRATTSPTTGMRFDVLEVEGNRIERIAVEFVERPQPRRSGGEFRAPEDEIE